MKIVDETPVPNRNRHNHNNQDKNIRVVGETPASTQEFLSQELEPYFFSPPSMTRDNNNSKYSLQPQRPLRLFGTIQSVAAPSSSSNRYGNDHIRDHETSSDKTMSKMKKTNEFLSLSSSSKSSVRPARVAVAAARAYLDRQQSR